MTIADNSIETNKRDLIVPVPADKNGRHFTIRDRNALFDSLSAADKRVAIAKDVIQQVLLSRFIPSAGTYVDNDAEKCYVCAIGAVAVSLLNGQARAACTVISRSPMVDYFTNDTLREMEAAFEECAHSRLDSGETVRDYSGLWEDNNLSDGCDECDYATERLLIVFANIINNGGEFVPENLENEIEAFKRAGATYWYGIAGVAQPVS